ncbi:hypothetical protein G7043_35975 [Lentzea sp. NEAU-D13]|uniref:DUF4352 domain-containing protein n=1 Tax=Lentzea alba TaxID=2714351 RepID=A0A7C9RW50_9PSEU|nr:hypothetical protein [Lentzea alba]NGY64327.1 hypothetical protein [Lentzea alba]
MAGGSPALRSTVVAVLTPVIGTAVAVVVNFATTVPDNVLLWVAVGVLTLVLSVLAAMSAGQAPPPPGTRQRTRGPSKGRAALIGFAVCLVIVAVLVPGARYAYGWVTGNETGVDRLAEPRSVTAGRLTMSVDRVEVTSHFTKVTMTVTNGYEMTVNLPVFGYSQLTSGTLTAEGEPFRSKWNTDIPPDQSRTGTIAFSEPLEPAATSVTVTFTHVFGAGEPGAPNSLAVRDVPLKPA